MPRKPRLNYRQVRKVLRQFGIMENPRRGKGSHRVFSHPNFRGSPRFYPVKCHNPNQQLSIKTLEGIRKAFDLTEEEFYYT
ncbi:MAG: type II toxin-antitoxin system HicA family toxin [Candidatus Poribacteria bacterium]